MLPSITNLANCSSHTKVINVILSQLVIEGKSHPLAIVTFAFIDKMSAQNKLEEGWLSLLDKYGYLLGSKILFRNIEM